MLRLLVVAISVTFAGTLAFATGGGESGAETSAGAATMTDLPR